MKRILILVFLVIACSDIYGQQIPQFSQYIWNSYLINPAIAGADNFVEAKVGYRNQWVGLEGAPQTYYLTIQGQKGKKLINREDVDVVNRRRNRGFKKPLNAVDKALGYTGRKYPTAPASFKLKGHHGFGGQIMHDRIGPFSTLGIYGSYAYHIPLARETYMSMGTFLGIKQYRIDVDKIILNANPSATPVDDNAIGRSGNLSTITPDAMVGLMVYAPKYYVGISMDQIFSNKLKFQNTSSSVFTQNSTLSPHYFLMGGYRVNLSEELAVVPSAIVRYNYGAPPSVDLTAKFNYKDLIWAGASMRAKDAFIVLFGISYRNMLDIGYSYDMTTSRIRQFSKGTHEIVLSYRMVNKPTTGCKPSYVW